MENFDKEDVLRVKQCAQELVDVLGKYFPDSPARAFTSLTYVLVQVTEILDVDPAIVVKSIEQSFAIKNLMQAEPPNEFVN